MKAHCFISNMSHLFYFCTIVVFYSFYLILLFGILSHFIFVLQP